MLLTGTPRAKPVHAGPTAARPIAIDRCRPLPCLLVGPVGVLLSDGLARVGHALPYSANCFVPNFHDPLPLHHPARLRQWSSLPPAPIGEIVDREGGTALERNSSQKFRARVDARAAAKAS